MNEAQNDAALIPAQAADHEDRRVLRLVLFDALASEAMGTLTTGVFLVGFAVALGADNFGIGVLQFRSSRSCYKYPRSSW